jgi:hypothetical protein
MASELITKNSGLVLPEVPKDAQWDYTKSVGKVGSFVFKWKTLKAEVPEILDELWIAREKLSVSPQEAVSASRNKSSMIRTWTDYCQEIGSSRQVVNRWLARAGYLAIARQKNEAEAVEAVEKASTGEVVLNGEPPLVEVRNGRPNKPNNAGDRANCAGQTRRRADGRGPRKRL